MPHPGFVNDFECAAQLLVARLGDGGVFRYRHHLVYIPHHVNDRNPRLGQRGEIIQRIALVGERLGFRHAVGLEAALPSTAPTGSDTFTDRLTTGPAFEVHHRGITIDRRHLLGVSRSPVINDQATAGHAL